MIQLILGCKIYINISGCWWYNLLKALGLYEGQNIYHDRGALLLKTLGGTRLIGLPYKA